MIHLAEGPDGLLVTRIVTEQLLEGMEYHVYNASKDHDDQEGIYNTFISKSTKFLKNLWKKDKNGISGASFITKSLSAMYDLLQDEEYEYILNDFQMLLLAEIIRVAKREIRDLDENMEGYLYPHVYISFFDSKHLRELLNEWCKETLVDYEEESIDWDDPVNKEFLRHEVCQHYKGITQIEQMDADNDGYALLWHDTDYKFLYKEELDSFLQPTIPRGSYNGGYHNRILTHEPLEKFKIKEKENV